VVAAYGTKGFHSLESVIILIVATKASLMAAFLASVREPLFAGGAPAVMVFLQDFVGIINTSAQGWC